MLTLGGAAVMAVVALQAPGAPAAVPGMDQVVSAGIRAGVFPGAVVMVGTRDRVMLARGYGHLTWSPASPEPTPDSTLYDLASLTKVVATTPAIMLLVDRGRVNLDRPVQAYLPGFVGPGKEAVAVRDLLSHQSGLRASLRLDSLTTDATAAKHRVLSEPLRWPPHTKTEYSDLNAMLLGWIIESVSGMPLDRFVEDSVLLPLGMSQTLYLPPRSVRTRIAPVSLWHGKSIAGEVHDQNAARLGGVSGHAGLYGTGRDLARYAQWYLNAGRAASGGQLLAPATIAEFTRRAGGDRALGWEMKDPRTTDNTGVMLSAATFGHTGFTGTSMWIDPVQGLYVVLLTNRVYAPRTRTSLSQLKQVRGHVADAAATLLNVACGTKALGGVAC